MKTLIASVLMAGSMTIAAICDAQAPAGSTGACKDGSYTSAASKRGACKDHGGVKDWYGSAPAAKEPAAPKAAAPAKAPAATAAQAPAATATTTPAAAKTSTAPAAAAPAVAGGPGQVWVNPKSKVYHCSGSKWYGKTKEGSYMSESAAKAAGNHPDHGKACS